MKRSAAKAQGLPSADEVGQDLHRHFDAKDGHWHVHVTQGDAYVTSNPEELLTTVLGSCVSACIRDPISGIGGMNHFLLPSGTGHDRSALRYGVNAMEILINGILKRGGDRRCLEAKLFGGANVVSALSDIGVRNAEFAKKYLEEEGIPVVGGDLGGEAARRIQFSPASGRARQMFVKRVDPGLVEAELGIARQGVPDRNAEGNDVELF